MLKLKLTRISLSFALMAAATVMIAGCGGEDGADGAGGADGGDKPSVAYVTNGVASFWVIAEKGAQDGAAEFDANVNVIMPKDVEDQKRKCEDLLARGIDGIAISPIDSNNQAALLKQISELTTLITHDSDAPDSDRLCYIGMDNYTAGRMCGALVKEALPDGGDIMIFVGRLGQENARLRRQGVIDELMDRSPDSSRYDQPGSPINEGGKYTVLDTRTDGFDFSKAKAQAQDAISKYPNLKGMVGLFAYNPPKILDAVREANKLEQIQVIGFDEEAETLQGIQDGEVYGTVVQNPYRYGLESVRVLAALARGDKSVIPEGGFLDIPARQIRKDNVDEFRAELDRLTSVTPAAADEAADADEPATEGAEESAESEGADAATDAN